MNFEKVLTFLLENFRKYNIRYALMGGFALHAAGYTRATEDLDVLILKEDILKVKKLLLGLGYDIAHESGDVINFAGALRELGQIDFLLAHRSYTKNMLKRARECEILKGQFKVKVIAPEDIIGLKIQASTNDPSRNSRDLADIEEILKRHADKMDLELLREYFLLFNREKELDDLLGRIKNA